MPIDRALTPWPTHRPALYPTPRCTIVPPVPLATGEALPSLVTPSPTTPSPSLRRCSSLPSSRRTPLLPLSPLLPPTRTILPNISPPLPPPPPPSAAPPPSALQLSPGERGSVSSKTASSASPASSGRQCFLEVFLKPGRHAEAAVFAYVFLNPPHEVLSPAPFIWEAVRTALPHASFDVLPSSRGSMLLRFQSAADCAEAVQRSPLLHEDIRVDLQPHDRSSACRHATRLVALSVLEFPLAHWHEEYILEAFQGFGTVLEIDWRCLSSFDYSSLRVVVQVEDTACVPGDLWVRDVSTGSCNVCQVLLIRSWSLEESVDAHGMYRPFFGPPPPPPPHAPATPPRLLPAPPAPPHSQSAGPVRPPPPPAPGLQPEPHARTMLTILGALLLQPQAPLLPPLPAFPIILNMTLLAQAPATSPFAARLRARAKRSADQIAKHKKGAQPPRSRHSDRLRAKESDTFEDMSSKATRHKALKNELSICSIDLKVQVKRRGLLRKRTLNAADLRAMAGTTNLSAKDTARLNKALAGSK
ncbi:hypothetical protein QOZ80_7AG0555300 [Eleusine coracana subsp. coracana]|nr:hypothetical protein QOZ80_7AG0555300 [Eleusine coracana subsp. coracana]